MFNLLNKFTEEEVGQAVLYYSDLFGAELSDKQTTDMLYTALEHQELPAVACLGSDLEYLVEILWEAEDPGIGFSRTEAELSGVQLYDSVWQDKDDEYISKMFRRVWSNYHIAICVHKMFCNRLDDKPVKPEQYAPVGG